MVSSMCPPRCSVSPTETRPDFDFSGHLEDMLGCVLGYVPGCGPNLAFETRGPRGQVQLRLGSLN